jgi:glycosyltransferase involved in cell wall biosynthesis
VGGVLYSLIVPIYKNEENIPPLLNAIKEIEKQLDGILEVVFVVDGSPDNSFLVLRDRLPGFFARSQLICLSRNFGAFAAIRAGLEAASGDYFAVLAADLQEPPSLVVEMFKALKNDECDVTVGERLKREDPYLTVIASNLFWWFYRKLIFKNIPPGGVDIFGCNRKVRDQLAVLTERNSSLVGLLFWVGFRSKSIPYVRAKREIGKSSWTFTKKWRYLLDSVYSFSDLPVILLVRMGIVGLLFSIIFGVFVLAAALLHQIDVPGYAATVLVVVFFGTLNLLALGVIGIYIWRAFENTKARPDFILMSSTIYEREQQSSSLQ